MKKAALLCLVVLGLASTASATTISYTVNMGGGSQNGNNVTNVGIIETNGAQTTLSFGFTINQFGLTTLTHDPGFTPTSTLIFGIDQPGTTPVVHLVFFTNDAFAQAAFGRLFSVVFPNSHHNDFANRLMAAEGGDSAQRDWLLAFFAGDGAPAAFASDGPNTGIEFTIGSPTAVPEPSTMVLMGLGLAGLGVAARRRKA